MTVFDEFQKYYRQKDLSARQWKESGGKVVGYFCDNVPEEFISAAGFFPLRLSGDPNGDTAKVGNYSEEGNVFSREGFVASMLHMLQNGRYDYLDYLIIPHARDSVHRLYPTLSRRKETHPDMNLPELFYLDNLHTSFYTAGVYNNKRWLQLKTQLEEWSGKPMENDKLAQAIGISNESKSLLKKLAALRASDPPRVSGVDALTIIGTSMFMPKEEHNSLLKKYLADAEQLPAKSGVRLFVEGSPLDHLQLYNIIESCGATVVAEDNCWGNRYSDVSINPSLDPTEAIMERYNNKSPCTRMYPLKWRVEYCLESALAAKARGVIFNVFLFDEMQAWETPDEIKVLKENGIPSLYLKDQPYRIAEPEALKQRIAEFIQSI
ncbi:MAG: 2-hydroxyacyl-CoA dehydratase family protein [Proteobacteria bacterium]|nr:2-hydroxyacyl-CoA dehydratase family protein [Pseudomonadota bacterium]MBU4471689.1 2-hydroxyacyl-CoA dehydratase family protein [Pseudomonadota bacterium]MCG2750664.1 2-hydroxyacyl-CoA dehydratase family protein [Desulfobacteraceae bacterium]